MTKELLFEMKEINEAEVTTEDLKNITPQDIKNAFKDAVEEEQRSLPAVVVLPPELARIEWERQ